MHLEQRRVCQPLHVGEAPLRPAPLPVGFDLVIDGFFALPNGGCPRRQQPPGARPRARSLSGAGARQRVVPACASASAASARRRSASTWRRWFSCSAVRSRSRSVTLASMKLSSSAFNCCGWSSRQRSASTSRCTPRNNGPSSPPCAPTRPGLRYPPPPQHERSIFLHPGLQSSPVQRQRVSWISSTVARVGSPRTRHSAVRRPDAAAPAQLARARRTPPPGRPSARRPAQCPVSASVQPDQPQQEPGRARSCSSRASASITRLA